MSLLSRFAFLLLFFGETNAVAKMLVFRTVDAPAENYHAFVRSSPGYEYPSEFELGRIPDPAARRRLVELFAQAQLDYTGGTMSQAEQDFRQIVELAPKDHWLSDDQSIFLYSYLRLAQLSHDPAESSRWINDGLRYAPEGKIESSYFPPPLLERFEQLRKEMSRRKLDLARFKPDFHFVLLNSRRVDLDKESVVEVPEGPTRVTLLSDAFKPIHVEMPAEQIAGFYPAKNAWVVGDCGSSQIRFSENSVATRAFFKTNCSTRDTTTASPPPIPRFDLRPLDSATQLPITASSSASEAKFYEKKWFWIGVGVAVVTGVLIASSQHSKTRTQTVNSEGF